MALGMLGGVFGGLAIVVWWAFLSRAPRSDRWGAVVLMIVALVATILLACGVWTLLRTDGMTGDALHDFAWRWAETSEERLLAQAPDELP